MSIEKRKRWNPEPDIDLDYDPFDAEDYEESGGKNGRVYRKLSDEELATQAMNRIQLFRTGSDFKSTTRDEIIGIDNILTEIDEIIHWLRHSKEYATYNSRLQPGVVFSGSPGTGKTLVSRWIASASNALFVNVRDFQHQHALFTDTDIRELFHLAREAYAREHRPIILFWDEFENAAIERSGERTTPEQKTVVSQLTAELDGIEGKNEGILLIGCTNYFHSIDSALIRRGRMGVHIEFHAPDRAGKEKILSYYLGQMKCDLDIDFNTLSYFFPKSNTAADIEEACVEAWRHAVRRAIINGEEPSMNDQDLVQVFIKQLVGPPTSFNLPKDELLPITIHECGHAITALIYDIPLRLITVQPGEKALGRVMCDDMKQYIGTVEECFNHMKISLGGVAAERTAGLPMMTGSVNDLQKLSEMAEHLVSDLMAGTRTGLLNYTALGRSAGYGMMTPQVSSEILIDADADVKEIIALVEKEAYACMERIGKDNLLAIAEIVMERVTLTGREFKLVVEEVCGYDPSGR